MDNNDFFKTVDSSSSNKRAKIGFFRGIFVPFISSILGTSLVLVLYLKVPIIKDKLSEVLNINNTSNTVETRS